MQWRRASGAWLGAMILGSAACSGGGATSDGGMLAVGPTGLDGGGPRLPLQPPGQAADWTFYGPDAGGPNELFGASLDDGGNLWVAGGEEGLFLLPAGASRYRRFTLADGLRPFGYMPDGSDPPGEKYLKVISVSGAAAGTVFVGYAGKPPAAGAVDCEDNWDGANPDPAIYKSGDADRVTLAPGGLSVVHYDIFSGPGIVSAELRGREKLCHVLRIRYDRANQKVWFGANHGFAMCDANYAGPASCAWASSPSPPSGSGDPLSNEYGHAGCSGVLEHVHPAINGLGADGSCCNYLTGGYYGVALDPVTHDVWFGGQMRTTRFGFGSTGGDYYTAQSHTEDPGYAANRIDVWPDRVGEPNIPAPADRVDDVVSGAAAMSDGSLWLSSFAWGLAHLDASGRVTARLSSTSGLGADKFGAIAADPSDGSVWAGTRFGPGIVRLVVGAPALYGPMLFGDDLANEGVVDIQAAGTGASRKIVVTFPGDPTHAGAVGVYSGP